MSLMHLRGAVTRRTRCDTCSRGRWTAGRMWRVRGLRSVPWARRCRTRRLYFRAAGAVCASARAGVPPQASVQATRSAAPHWAVSQERCARAWIFTGGEGLSRSATRARRARARACVAPFPLGTSEARAAALGRGVRARGAEFAISLASLEVCRTSASFAVLASGAAGAKARAGSAVRARRAVFAISFSFCERFI